MKLDLLTNATVVDYKSKYISMSRKRYAVILTMETKPYMNLPRVDKAKNLTDVIFTKEISEI
jgi:hypothetical protein